MYRILYVDDEKDLLEIVTRYLERTGEFTVTTATGAPEAIRLLEHEKFDAIVSDYLMPGMDGIQFLVEVRKRFGSIPFILFTGRGREEVVIQAINSGADFYLQKGGEPKSQFAELTHKIKSAVIRHTSETALHASEEKYRRIVETSHEGIWAIDENFVTTYVNTRMAEMLGLTADGMLGKTIQHFLVDDVPSDKPLTLELWLREKPNPHELRLRAQDGSIRTFNISTAPIIGDDGAFKGAFAMLTDLTLRKQDEKEIIQKNDELRSAYENLAAAEEELKGQFDALAESEGRVRQKLESLLAPDGDIGTLDLSDIIDKQVLQQLMEEFTRLTGMVTAILDGKGRVLIATGWQPICTKFHRIHPVTAQYCTESDLHLEQNLKQGEFASYKCKNNLWDVVTPLYIGNRHMGNIYTGQFFYDDETIDESVFIAQAEKYGFDREEYLSAFRQVPRFSRDTVTSLMKFLVELTDFISKLSYSNLTLARTITERDTLFASLKKSEERLRLTLNSTNDGIWDWNIPSGTAFFSPRWFTLLGYEPEELPYTYATWRSLLHPDDLEPTEQKIQSHIGERNESYSVEFRMRTKEGGWKWILARGKVVERDSEGKPVRMVGTHTDISEQKQVQEELARKHDELQASYEQITASEEELRASYEELAQSEQVLRISERRLVMAQEIGQTGCWEYSLISNTIWGSAEGLRMFGFPAVAKEVPIEDIESRIQERERVHQALVDLITSGQEYNLEYTINPANGSSPRMIHSVARLDKDPQGNPLRVVGVIKDITERKRAEDALLSAHERLRSFIDSNIIGVVIASASGNIIEANDYYLHMLGYTREEFEQGMVDWRKITPPEWLPADDRAIAELRERGRCEPYEKEYIRHDGSRISVFLSDTILPGPKEQLAAFVIDITERKRAEDALQKSEQKYRNLYQFAQVGLFETRLKDGTVAACNERYAFLAGYSSVEDALGKDIVHLYANPEDRKEVIRILHEQGHIDDHIVQFKNHKTGKPFWAQFSARINREKDAAEGSIIDITERIRAEKAIQLKDELLYLTGEMAQVGGWEFDTVTQEGTWTDEVAKIHDLDTSQPTNASLGLSFYTGSSRTRIESALQEAIEMAKPYDLELEMVSARGRHKWVRTIGKPVLENGKVVKVRGVFQDITEYKRIELEILLAHRDLEQKVIERTRELSDANERLKELDRLKSMFIASMSHELRTPLNSIIGFTGIMVKGMTGELNPEQKKQLGMVQESARHLLALINDVIDISKIEAGKIEASVSTFDFADVLREVQHTLGSAAAEQGLTLNIEIPASIEVTSDDRRIKQIILNLVSNAIKFTDEGRIDVTVQRKGDIVEVAVRDTGIGIGREDLVQLFHPFVRVQVPGRLTEGTGLGLYLSKKIARFLGGDIVAESELHTGSVFMFSFPVRYVKQEEEW